MTEQQNTPELRFPEFEGEWEKCTLADVVNVYDGTHQTPKYTKEGIKFLSVENIKTLKSHKYISKYDFDKGFKNYPEFGDILMTRIGDIGTPKVVNLTEPLAYYVSLALLKPYNINSYFLESLILSPTVQNELWRKTLHIAFPKKINKNEIAKVLINYPEKAEQEKLGTFFNKLDRQIELEEEKLELLEEQKNGYMQKIFSQELRFKNEKGKEYPNWKSKKLSNVSTIIRGLTYKPSDIRQKGVRVLRSSNIVNDKFHTYEDDIFVDENVVKIPLANEEDILITAANGSPKLVGKHALIKALKQDSVAGGFMYLLKSKNTKFIQIWMNTKEYKKIINKVQGGNGSIGNLSRKDLENGIITMPCLEEQEKIGLFFSKIDVQIEVLVNKIRNLKKRKQGLLQKMFM